VDYNKHAIAFCYKEHNEKMLRVGHCTTLEVLAFAGRRLHGTPGFVVLDDVLRLDIDHSQNASILQLGPSFAALLDEFCSGKCDSADVAHFRQFIKEYNTDVASLSQLTAKIPLHYCVTVADSHGGSKLTEGVATEEKADASAHGSGSGSSRPDAAPKACPVKRLREHSAENDVGNDGAQHLFALQQIAQTDVALLPFIEKLCKTHKPSKKAKRESATYWFLNACRDGCLRCVKLLVEECGVRKDVLSNSGSYNGRDFAEDSARLQTITQQKATEICTYLT